MFKLDNDFLIELGLGDLPEEDKKAMLRHIYETLEMRVGMNLAEQMTDEQQAEFEGYIQRNDETGALQWLETNFPGYKQVVADELEKLKTEVKTAAPQILASSQQPADGQAPAAPQQPAATDAPAPGAPTQSDDQQPQQPAA
ncbi:hypothetical protein CR970_01855 [Candidatus Saccharibacteria bacterium]|nr:MAG: hypothetical protein CR970_01855 [Candidatus Saccharibacteria bacterium]